MLKSRVLLEQLGLLNAKARSVVKAEEKGSSSNDKRPSLTDLVGSSLIIGVVASFGPAKSDSETVQP